MAPLNDNPVPDISDAKEDEPRLDPADLKVVGKRLLMKLSRFAILGAIYYSYLTFEDLPAENTWGFPIIYLYVWAGFTVFIGIFLFVLGRPTLMDESITSFILGSHFSWLRLLCDGTVYKYFGTFLKWLYPYVVVTSWGCYCRTKIRHSRFVLYYFAFLVLVEMKKLKRIQYLGHLLIALSHLYLCLLAYNWWGAAGAALMIVNLKLVMEDDECDYWDLGFGVKMAKPLLFAMTSMAAGAVVTQSIQVMSGMVDGRDLDLPHITVDDLLCGLKPLLFKLGDAAAPPSAQDEL